MPTEKFERLREQRVKSVANDVPDRFAPVDDQLVAEYGEEVAELIRQQQLAGQ